MKRSEIKTLGQLKEAGYKSQTVQEEMKDNLLIKLRNGESIFPGIQGYEDSVIPAMERAILAGHSINLLGLRGQAKTRMARLMTGLLDECIPVVKGSEVNDDPLRPLSSWAKQVIEDQGDEAPISWLHRDERYADKLATPDVNIADLIGDIDPIKAAKLRLSYSDEGVIHFGMIPRANRCIFVINELPDLQPRIQVALFNILQEGDIQIRGFKLRFPLDMQFVFTANPEDYTNRGSIITPLKDRIQSQIITHYPESAEIGMSITRQEVRLKEDLIKRIEIPVLMERLVEQVAIEARQSEYVDEKSGVSARLTITAYETMVAAAERRMALNQEKRTCLRIADLTAAIPAIVGKIEMVYEGEQEGAVNVARRLIAAAIRNVAPEYFMDISQLGNKKRPEAKARYQEVLEYFESKNVDLISDSPDKDFSKALREVKGLEDAITHFDLAKDGTPTLLRMEFLLHALAEYSVLDKKQLGRNLRFVDYLSSVMPWQEN